MNEGGGSLPDALAYVDSRLPRWCELFQQLVQIPSLFEAEHAISEFVTNHIGSLGVQVHRIPHDFVTLSAHPKAQRPYSTDLQRASLAVRLPGSGAGRSLALNTHLDVVAAGDESTWTYPPFAGHIDEEANILYGRGAMDDKAGVIISLAVLETLIKTPCPQAGDVLFHYVLEDEITGNGTLLCLEAGYTADAAIIIDGTRRDKAINQHAGNVQFEIALTGRPASVSVSHIGVNAAEMLARLVLDLREAVFDLNAQRAPPWTMFPSPFQFVIQMMQAEGEPLTVPVSARARCYVTFPPPYTLATFRKFLSERVMHFTNAYELPQPPQLIWSGFATEPVSAQTSVLAPYLQAAAAACGFDPIQVVPSTGTSDLRHFVFRGIPALLYGPGKGFNPHRPDEHYYLDELPHMIRFCLELIHRWCGTS